MIESKGQKLLWEEFVNLKNRRGETSFSVVKIRGTILIEASIFFFDAAFVDLLNEKKWIPDSEGELKAPNQVLFESLEWKKRSIFYFQKYDLKQPIVDQLEKSSRI